MAKKKKTKKDIKGQLGKKKETAREKMIGQTIGYRYDVNLLPDYKRLTPFLKKYIEAMGWDDLNWLEDVHMGYEEDRPAVFDRNANGWVTIPKKIKLPDNQQAVSFFFPSWPLTSFFVFFVFFFLAIFNP